jgi:hypothetical protein
MMVRSEDYGGRKEEVNARNNKRNNEKYSLKMEATCCCETW